MHRFQTMVVLVMFAIAGFAQEKPNCDAHAFSGVETYRNAPAQSGKNGPKIVLIGADNVQRWDVAKTFPNANYINRGISGQGTAQMLLRFYQDVVLLHPRLVVIFENMDDLQNGMPELDIQQNTAAMAQLAKANGIRVAYASLFPTNPNGGHPFAKSVSSERIRQMNRWMFGYAKEHGDTYIDLWSKLGDTKYDLLPQYSVDGVHINDEGYKLIAPILEKYVAEALQNPMGRVSIKADFKQEE